MRSWSSNPLVVCAAVSFVVLGPREALAQRVGGGGGAAAAPSGYRGGPGFGGGGSGLAIGLGIGLGAAMLGAAAQASQPARAVPPADDHPRFRGGADRPLSRPRRHRPIAAIQSVKKSAQPPVTPPPVRTPQPPPRPGFAVPALDERRYVPDEVLVTIKAPVAPDALRRLEVEYGLTPLAKIRIALLEASVVRYRLRQGTSVPQAIRALRGSPSFVDAVQPNFVFALQDDVGLASTNAPIKDATHSDGSPTKANLERPVQYAIEALHLTAAHRVATGANVLIAIIDTGLDETHPEISGTVADRFDAIGGRFIAQAHGTAMAGVIVAHQTLVGIAPDAHVIAIRAFSTLPGGSASGTGFDILRGLDFAATHGARIVNMSFAGPRDALLRQALEATRQRGIVAIAAAGNAGPAAKPLYPAAEPGVIAVTATDAHNELFPMANRGAYVAVAAPGVDILAPGLGGGLQLTSGTSIATAEASGVAALLMQQNGSADGALIRKILSDTARRIPDWAAAAGVGVIDADAAVNGRVPVSPVSRKP